jgi:hypothetical protein
MQKGFRQVASYECFKKGQRKQNIECFTNGTEYLVRHYQTGKTAWDSFFTDKDSANALVLKIFNQYSFHKRVL